MKNCITRVSYNISLTNSTLFVNRVGYLSLFQIIFDFGASKAIIEFKDGFIESPPPNELRLSNMVNRVLIKGIKIVK